jgi:DNA-binding GntR family transcriptional regulator
MIPSGMQKRTPRSAKKGSPPASADVVEWVRERIRHGRLVPGQRLIEADVMAATGASRGRVREALRRLEAEGLLTIEEFRGASVKQLSLDEIRQIYRTRMALEGLAAAECALRADPEFRQRLLAIQAELDECEHEHSRFAKLNDAWHKLVIAGARNEYVAQFLLRLTVPIYRLLFSTFYTADRIKAANADHRVITAAIVEGRVDDADRAMRAHISNGLEALMALNAHFDT